MKILHIGWGYRPLRAGGLIEYTEDLMEIQIKNGYDIAYFCSGDTNLFVKNTYLKAWKHKKQFDVFEIINSPIQLIGNDGTLDPEADYSQDTIERLFIKALSQFSPDIVHFQEFFGLPTSFVKICKENGIKTVYTIEDYYPLCPTLKLLKPDRTLCTRVENVGVDCVLCCAKAKKVDTKFLLRNKAKTYFNKYINSFFKRKIKSILILLRTLMKSPSHKIQFLPLNDLKSYSNTSEYTKRRQQNLKNISTCDLLIAMSSRVSEIFSNYCEFTNLIVLNLTVKNIDLIEYKSINIDKNSIINFVGINILGGFQKGADLMFEVFDKIDKSNFKHKLNFNILGGLDSQKYGHLLNKYDFVKYLGSYEENEINTFLDKANGHIGIVPSVWEEAYGFVGIEFLAKGMPVIGNKMGGITDYVRNGETGWLNNSSTANEMFEIIESIIAEPDVINKINVQIQNCKFVKSMQFHFNEMDLIYKNLLN